jgi:hypothetical protein
LKILCKKSFPAFSVQFSNNFFAENQKTHQYLEITWIPDILKSQIKDVNHSLERLANAQI